MEMEYDIVVIEIE